MESNRTYKFGLNVRINGHTRGEIITVGTIVDGDATRGYVQIGEVPCNDVAILTDLVAYLCDPKAKDLFVRSQK